MLSVGKVLQPLSVEGNWGYCFLWRKRKGVGEGIKGMHAPVSRL